MNTKEKKSIGKRVLCALICMVFLATAFWPLTADARTTRISRTIRVGYIDYGGFISRGEGGSCTGYGVDYLNAVAGYTGWQYEYIYDTWDNQLKNLQDGKIDCLCQAQKTPEREKDYLFSKYSVGSEANVLYAGKDDDRFYFNDFESFNGIKVAVLKNSYQNHEFEEYAKKKGFACTYLTFDTTQECFQALQNKKVDGVAMGSLALQNDCKIICRFGSDPFYFMTGQENQDLVDAMDDAIAQITANNSTFSSDLYKKYYGSMEASDLVLTREEAEYIRTAEPVTIGLIADRAPFSYINEQGEPDGITVDIMKQIAKTTGLKFNYEMLKAGERTLDYLKEHPTCIVSGVLAENPQFQSDDYIVSDVFDSDDVSLVCRQGMQYDLGAEDASYVLAVPKSYAALQSYIQKNYPQFKLVEGTTTSECVKMVLKGEADFTAQNVNVLRPVLQNPHNEGLTILPTFFMNENMAMVGTASDEMQMIMNIINKSIVTLSDEEVSQYTVNHSVANGYRLSWNDMLYKFRYTLSVIVLMIGVLAGLLMRWRHAKQLSLKRMQEKNVQLAEAVAQADNANRAKSQFLARMSHEIRTPMNAIVGLTEIATHYEKEPERIDEYLGKIQVSSKVLLNIINDVLDMSAIESDKIKIGYTVFNLRELLTSISTIYYSQCKQKGIRFEMNTAEINHENLLGDGLRVNQVLLNLVSNAFKFTPAGGTITITAQELSVREGKAYYNFIVKDTGEGMTDEMLGRLFRPFEQEDAATAQKHGGSGLGLSIAKNLIEMMSGSISVESEKNVGTTFTVSLPFDLDRQVQESVNEKYRQVRALIVDDEPDSREYISVILSRIGVPYATAANGTEAMEKLTHAKETGSSFDICFVDWKMPDMNGGDVIRKIRESFAKDTLVIIVSAYDTQEIQEEAVSAGADLFLTKPLFQSTVFDLLMQLSGGKCAHQTAEEEAYDFTGRKVLLAEDTEFNAEVATELLDLVHMKVDHAPNGKRAVEMFEASKEGTYTAILMDVQMPEMDGYEAAREIRAGGHPQAKTIPIYAMTANAFTEDISAALNAGMNGHIAKPIDTDILYATLKKAAESGQDK